MSTFGNAGTSGGGLFGTTNPQQQQQQPGASNAFGSRNPNPNPTPNPLTAQPTQIFGTPSTTTNTNPGGVLFGSTNTNTQNQTGGGLFGSTTGTNTNQQSAFGTQPQQQQPSTGLFGSTANNPLFGNTGTSNTTTGTTGTSLFGNPSTNPSQATGGGLFGQQQNQPGTTTGTTGTGGGLFGSTTTTSTGSGLFGSNTQLPTQPTGTGIFGSTQTGGGLFGGGAKPATGGGLFGSTTTPATSTTTTTTNPLFGGSLFGQPQQAQQQQQQQQQQPQQQQGGLFGSTAGNPLFGGNKSTLGTSSLGVPLQQTTGFGAFTTPGNLLGSRSTAGTHQQPADAQAQFQQLTQSIEKIYNSWNPQSPECQFQYYFYNLVDPKQVSLYGRPLNATNEALWEKAVRENPDPSCLVPVLAVGFDDLRARIDAQAAQSASHIQKLNEAKSRLAALRTQHDVSNSSRLLRAASVQTQVTQRLMRLIQHLHLLIPAVRSSALTPEEEALRGKLEELDEELKRTRVKGRLNELWSLIGALGANLERAGGAGGDWAVVDEEGLAQITQILSEQQNGLQHLTRILQKGKMDLNVVLGMRAPREEDSGEALWDSTSTLRASALR